MVPLALGYLGSERYGLWITLTSLLSMFGFADLGLGNGLLNAIGEAHGKDDQRLASGYIATGFFMLSGVAVIVAAVGFAISIALQPDWKSLFNLTSDHAASESSRTVAVLLCCFVLALPLSVAQRVRMGYQQGFVNSMFTAVGSVLGIAGVTLAVLLDGGLPWVAGTFMAAPLVAQLMNTALLVKDRPWTLPRFGQVDLAKATALLRVGLLFFVLQLAFAVAYTSDNLIIARILGSEAVTDYAVPHKLFSLAPMAMSFVLTPLWPAFREAHVRGDLLWVRRTFARSVRLSIALSLPSALILFVLGRPVVESWTSNAVSPSLGLLAALSVSVILNGFLGPAAMLMNALHVVAFQMCWATLMAVANIALSIVLVGQIGIAGAVIGTVISQVLFLVVPYALYIRRLLTNMVIPGDASRFRTS